MSLIIDSHKFKQGKTGILLYFINTKNVFEHQIYIKDTVSIKKLLKFLLLEITANIQF